MTLTTGKVTKRRPKPKAKAKPSTKQSDTTRKRAARDSDDDGSQEDDEMRTSDISESARKAKKRDGKRRRVEVSDSEEMEIVDGVRPCKNVEDVDDAIGDDNNEELVSPNHLPQALLTHHTVERWSQ